MVVRRRIWLYRLAGQRSVQTIAFEHPVTSSKVREALKRSVGLPIELWGRASTDLLRLY